MKRSFFIDGLENESNYYKRQVKKEGLNEKIIEVKFSTKSLKLYFLFVDYKRLNMFKFANKIKKLRKLLIEIHSFISFQLFC